MLFAIVLGVIGCITVERIEDPQDAATPLPSFRPQRYIKPRKPVAADIEPRQSEVDGWQSRDTSDLLREPIGPAPEPIGQSPF